MRGRKLRSVLTVVPLVMILAVLGSGPAFASPLRAATATAYGARVDLLGTTLIQPTPLQTAGPAPGTGSDNLVTVPLSTLAFAGVAGAKAQTTRDATLTPELPANELEVTAGGPGLPSTFNAQAYGRTTGATVLAANVPALVEALTGSSQILSADVIHAEALASCVNGRAVLAGGSQAVGLNLLGMDLSQALDGTVNQVVSLADSVLGILGASLVLNEQVRTADSLTVNALHLTIPNILEVIVGHAEVTGTSCEPVPQCEDGIDNDGDGRIDFPADPQCKSRDDDSEAPECSNNRDDDGDGKIDRGDPGCYSNGRLTGRYDPNDDTEADLLPRTGGDAMMLGVAIFALGGLMLVGSRRLRRSVND